MIIIAVSQLYVWILALEGTPQSIANFVIDLNLSPIFTRVISEIILGRGRITERERFFFGYNKSSDSC